MNQQLQLLMHQPPPSLKKIDQATKNLIKDRISKESPDDAIIKEFADRFEISSEIIAKIRQESTPFNIGELSNNAGLVPRQHVPDGPNITPHADVAVVPRYLGLSTIERVALDSDEGARNTPFPIASISKSFCGAVCALMDVDGKFGEKGIDATLQEVLEYAKLQHPGRAEKIDEYQQMLKIRGFSDVKISELLNHQSGCRDADHLAPSSCKDKTPLEFFLDHLEREENKGGQYHYSNVGYTLLEEIVNLVSDKGSYKQELQERIFAKLELTNTGLLEDSDPKSDEARRHLGRAVFIPGSKESPHSDKIIETHTEFSANHTTPLGAVHASCGGLYSSVNDLEKVFEELGKAVAGQANSLTDNPEAVSELYRRGLRGSSNYSLGVEFEEGQKEEGQKCAMGHKGQFPGNLALVKALMPCSLAQLRSNSVIELGVDERLTIDIFMTKFDYTVSSHFTEKAGAIPTAMLKEFVNSRLDDAERKRFSDASGDKIEKYLIEKERLPKDFAKTCEEIFNAFRPAGDRVKEFLRENYLNEDGVIDGAKIAKDFKTTEDVDKAIGPMFSKSKEIAAGILSKLSESLTQTGSLTERTSESTSAPKTSAPKTSSEITGSRHATADIAEEANKTLEREKSKKSSEGVVSSQGSPSSSPRALEQPPLRASPPSSPGR